MLSNMNTTTLQILDLLDVYANPVTTACDVVGDEGYFDVFPVSPFDE